MKDKSNQNAVKQNTHYFKNSTAVQNLR